MSSKDKDNNKEFNFDIEEIAEIFKNKDNIIYLLTLNGIIIRIFITTQINDFINIFEKYFFKEKKFIKSRKSL